MSVEEKFNAAVNVIRSLPKNGAYQPSNELMLRFYSYYKQATEGPCQYPKPAFWELVKKAKWDAWMRLGNMSRIEAMNNYVEELKKPNSLTPVDAFRKSLYSKYNTSEIILVNFQIVETMSYTDNVANFLGSLDSFYESVPAEDLELLVGPVLERIRSQPGSPLSGSPLGSRETSPTRVRNTSRHITSSLETSPASSHSASPLPPDTDGEDDEFKDTVESAPERSQKDLTKSSNGFQQQIINNSYNKSNKPNAVTKEHPSELVNGYSHVNGYIESSDAKHERGRSRGKRDDKGDAEFFNQIALTMQNLQKDLDRITARVRNLEGQALTVLAPQPDHRSRAYPKWWPLSECSPRMFALLILWPFAAQALVSYAQRYRQRKLLREGSSVKESEAEKDESLRLRKK